MKTRMSKWSRVVLIGLWTTAVASIALDVAASCSHVFESAELTLTAVTIDGAEADVEAHIDGYAPVTVGGSSGGVSLRSANYNEHFSVNGEF